jgi:hypothetical protein
MTLLKNVHHDPRPFWANEEIQPIKCYAEYGNPSGHSLLASFFAMYLFTKLFEKPQPKSGDLESALAEQSTEDRTKEE